MFIDEDEASIVLESEAPLDLDRTSKETEKFVTALPPRVAGTDRYKFLFGMSSGSFSNEASPSFKQKDTFM